MNAADSSTIVGLDDIAGAIVQRVHSMLVNSPMPSIARNVCNSIQLASNSSPAINVNSSTATVSKLYGSL